MRPAASPQAWRALALSCLAGLALLFAGMFTALMAGVAPHPPAVRGPYILACLAVFAAAGVQFGLRAPGARALGLVAALLAWPGIGLHKFLVEADPGPLAPVLVVGSAAVLALALASLRAGAAGDQAEGIGW